MVASTVVWEPDPEPAPDEEENPRLSATDLSLTLGDRIVLDHVALRVRPGEIFGILGPNGSGKTTLLRCLTGLLRPQRGAVQFDGALLEHNRTHRARIGAVFQTPSFDPKLRVEENLRLAARLYAIPRAEAQQRCQDLLRFMELEDRRRDFAAVLSGGLQRRLELARALIHSPSVLLLDEPTQGLDMTTFARLWQRLHALRRAQALTIVVSTHNAEEAAQCDRLAVLERGKVVACGAPEDLMAQVAPDVITLETDDAEAVAPTLQGLLELSRPARSRGRQVIVECDAGHTLIPRLVEALPPGSLRSVVLRQPTLADAFFHLTGKSLDESVHP